MSHKVYLVCLYLLFVLTCSAQNCKDLPNVFTSVAEAARLIKSSKFSYIDYVSTQKSSWIHRADYYSCDAKTGFFVLLTKTGEEYIFQGLPINFWRGFKTAQSHGQFYNQHIRSRYQLKTKKL